VLQKQIADRFHIGGVKISLGKQRHEERQEVLFSDKIYRIVRIVAGRPEAGQGQAGRP